MDGKREIVIDLDEHKIVPETSEQKANDLQTEKQDANIDGNVLQVRS